MKIIDLIDRRFLSKSTFISVLLIYRLVKVPGTDSVNFIYHVSLSSIILSGLDLGAFMMNPVLDME